MAYEDRPEKDTPDDILAELTEYGGLSPSGQPIWRLVLAQNCRVHCFGWRNHIARNTAEMGEFERPTNIEPDRIEDGEFWIPRYRIEGWILQRWYPPMMWGSRQQWESEKARDGRRRLLAAYPQAGDYMMVPVGPWKTLGEVGDLKAAIRAYNMAQRRNPANWANYEAAQLAFEESERQASVDAYATEMAAQFREGAAGVLRTASETAQRFRGRIAGMIGTDQNLGAGDKWG